MGETKVIFIILMLSAITTGCGATKIAEKAADKIDFGSVKNEFFAELQIVDANLTNLSVNMIDDSAIFNITYKMTTIYNVKKELFGHPDRMLVFQGHSLIVDDVIQTPNIFEIVKTDTPDKKVIQPNTVDYSKTNVILAIPYNQLSDSGTIYYIAYYFQQIEGEKNKEQIKNGINIGLAYQKNKNNKNIVITNSAIGLLPR